MVGLGDEQLSGERTCGAAKCSEDNDWDIVAGSRVSKSGSRIPAVFFMGRFGVDDDQVWTLDRGDLGAAIRSASLEHLGAAPCEQ
jgi:hypothetical protein